MANATTCSTDGTMARSAACSSFMQNYCSTDELLGDTYKEKWQGDEITSQCRAFVALNSCNLSGYVPVTDAYVRRYLITDATPITYPQQGSLVYQPSIEDVVEVCKNYVGACDPVLSNVCPGYTREDLANNPNLAKLCGCFMSDAEYDKYGGTFGTQKICDPACVLQSAVKPRDPSTSCQTLKCSQTVCIIDDITIDILGKSTVGDITFGQACSGCSGGAGCTCSISDISITSVESTLGNINLSQACGGNPSCYKRDANGIPRSVPCSELGGTGNSTVSSSPFTLRNILIVIGIIIVVIIIIVIIALLIRRNRNEPTMLRSPEYLAPPPPNYFYSGAARGPAGFGNDSIIGQAPLI